MAQSEDEFCFGPHLKSEGLRTISTKEHPLHACNVKSATATRALGCRLMGHPAQAGLPWVCRASLHPNFGIRRVFAPFEAGWSRTASLPRPAADHPQQPGGFSKLRDPFAAKRGTTGTKPWGEADEYFQNYPPGSGAQVGRSCPPARPLHHICWHLPW